MLLPRQPRAVCAARAPACCALGCCPPPPPLALTTAALPAPALTTAAALPPRPQLFGVDLAKLLDVQGKELIFNEFGM